MKRIILLILSLTITLMSQALTVVSTAGGLSTAITAAGGTLSTVTNLTVTGSIDARDFVTMGNNMYQLAVVDLSGATIESFNGTLPPPANPSTTFFPANTLPENAFQSKPNLISVNLPISITSISNSAFSGCDGLTSITIPTSVSSIGSYAFQHCSSLTSITIPSLVTFIGNEAFNSCSAMINVDVTNLKFSSVDGVLYNKTQTSLIQCPISKTGSFIIPTSVDSIRNSAFRSCEGLTSVTIPSSVNYIGDFAFFYCSDLTSVTIPSSVTSIGSGAFENSGLISITIPSLVTSIGYYAFAYCTSLTTVNYNATNCTNMLRYVFDGCLALNTLNIGNDVTTIPAFAFSGCAGLKSVNFSSSLTSIGQSAFSGSGLTTVNLPSSLTSIEYQTFLACDSLTSITIPSSITSIGESAFMECHALDSVFIPSSVITIGKNVFTNSNAYINVDINNPSFSSMNGVLFNKTQTKLIHYPLSVIGGYTIPSTVTSLESFSFAYCPGLTSIILPPSLASIKDYAFYICSGLESIIMPSSITSIGVCNFQNCTNLDSIYVYQPNPVFVNSYVFANVNKSVCTLFVPYGSKYNYMAATEWKDFIIEEMPPSIVKGVYGNIFNDLDGNCLLNDEPLFNGFKVLITPGNYIAVSKNGYWSVDSIPLGTYTATVDTTLQNWNYLCQNSQTFEVLDTDSLLKGPDFGLQSKNVCTSPDVSISAPMLRRCFSNQIIYVQARNDFSALSTLTNAYVEIQLDSLISVNSVNLAYTNLGNNKFKVPLGNLMPGQSKDIQFSTTISCAAVLNQTLCMKATIYPIDSCVLAAPVPNPPSNGEVSPCTLPWDKSSLKVDGKCLGDSIQFSIKNGGVLGGGDMDCFSPVRVFVDGNIYLRDSIRLQGQETKRYNFAGTGQTWRLEADQHPLHPGKSRPNASVERCGSAVNWTPGLITALPQDDIDPVVDIFCGMVRGSFDPNDKQGFPLGINSTHDILPNQDLEYLIRFQNTGTDTAFTVVIRDTLDMDLDILTVVGGTTSHPATFRMYGPRVLEWTFNNILLPDSTTNSAGSNGFVSFKVSQLKDLNKGTEIMNNAAIYFDYNEPVITNTTLHTINPCINTMNVRNTDVNATDSYYAPDGNTYTLSGIISYTVPGTVGCDSIININLRVASSTAIEEKGVANVVVFPNPFVTNFTIRFEDADENHTIYLYDMNGKVVYQETSTSNAIEVNIGNYSVGVYLLEVKSSSKKSSYKLIKK